MQTRSMTIAIAGSALALSACAPMDEPMVGAPAERVATAELRTATNANVGTATATAMADGIQIVVEGMGMPPGPHGAHVHTTGRCDAPGFESAGGHWNPTTMQHGAQNPAGPHAGDMPNLDVASDGAATLTFTLPSGTMEGLLDGDGSAMMVHAGPDDMKTDPSGNSGSRIACGVFRET
ncbi:superoxide dismutase family protein [Sphingomonas japonica]|uniref:Cu-Zn family superoxide dismutase n=1 Tax=Sphingomonas japonica TaxID=511662 RepID=A0ABX0U4Z6_9SPHN|nr:Cu-Zn family superoxide dismutase [Sphingomonas japonica]